MEWFDGGVLNAIKMCRQKKALFIVYITDESPASLSTSKVWNQEQVLEVLKNNAYVALKISKDSTEFNQFSQFFAVFVFPSIYCIDLSGKPLLVLNGQQTEEMLKIKLNEAFLKLKEQLTPETELCASSTAESNSPPHSPQPTPTVEASKESAEEKLKRYEDKIRERRTEKIASEREHEKVKEKERRSLGKNLAKLKEKQEEQRNRNWMTERQKQKDDARKAREEVRAKLEQDRREREDSQRARASLRQRSQETSKSDVKRQSSSGVSRVQLRLPMGSTKVIEVNCSDTLSVLRQKAAEVVDATLEKFSLIRLYPREELTSDMDLQSLEELKLVPTGVVIVKVDKRPGGSSIIWTALMSMVNFIIWLFNIIKKSVVNLFWSPSTTPAPDESRQQLNRERRTRGGIQRFNNGDDSSDDMGTYNGNSTQQQ